MDLPSDISWILVAAGGIEAPLYDQTSAAVMFAAVAFGQTVRARSLLTAVVVVLVQSLYWNYAH